jgi:hypothetical protein
MISTPFRDVLWGLAKRRGLDPAKDLHGEQADAYATYINTGVAKLWHAVDWPEWTRTEARTPDARHIVSYDAPAGAPATPDQRIGRALKVYLNDPETVPWPLEIAHRLTERGVHCGFEHGTEVWIKFQPPPPEYTARPWDVSVTYRRGELVYSPATGECYVSNTSGNQGHNPTGMQGVNPPSLNVAVVQTAAPETPAIPARTQITKVTQATELLASSSTEHHWDVLDGAGALITSVSYLAIPGASPADVLTAVYASLDADPALDDFFFNLNTADLTIHMEAFQLFGVRSYYYTYVAPPDEVVVTGVPADPTEAVTGDDTQVVVVGSTTGPVAHSVNNEIVNIQYYNAAVTFVPATPQIIELYMPAESAVRGASYELTFTDVSGALHIISYVNSGGLSSLGILQGMVNEIQTSTDPFFGGMATSINPALLKLTFAHLEMVSLNADVVPMGNTWWTLRLFPLALLNPVIAWANAEALKEEGQTDKGAAELALAVPSLESASFQALPNDPLTDQVRPVPRYRVSVAATGPAQQQ